MEEVRQVTSSVHCPTCGWKMRLDEDDIVLFCPCMAEHMRLQTATYDSVDIDLLPMVYGFKYRVVSAHEWNAEVQ